MTQYSSFMEKGSELSGSEPGSTLAGSPRSQTSSHVAGGFSPPQSYGEHDGFAAEHAPAYAFNPPNSGLPPMMAHYHHNEPEFPSNSGLPPAPVQGRILPEHTGD
jgi:hypothetical protein